MRELREVQLVGGPRAGEQWKVELELGEDIVIPAIEPVTTQTLINCGLPVSSHIQLALYQQSLREPRNFYFRYVVNEG